MDETARRLFDAGSAQTEGRVRSDRRASTSEGRSLLPTYPTAAGLAGHSESEAEEALRGLEAEWAMRMEAPLSALANLEASVSREIVNAERSLPLKLRDAAAMISDS